MKKLWFSSILCCIWLMSFGQGTTPPPPVSPGSYMNGEEILSHIYSMDMNYHHIVQYAEIYLDSFPNDESFAKQFGRWSGFWNSRVDASGDFDATYRNMMSVLDNYPICRGDDADWEQTGPIINTQNLGVIVTVAAPSGQSNIIYAGSNTGGLWKTENEGDTWSNVTDILGFPGLGVNDIIIHPNNPDILYIATGYNYSFIPQNYGAGVFISMNGGETWKETNLTWDPLTSTEARERLAINKLAFHPTDPSIIFALSHFEVYKMQMLTNPDGTISGWNETTVTPPNELSKYIDIEFVETAPNIFDTYISTIGTYINGAGHSGSLFRSTNYGDNNAWTKIPIKSPPTSGTGAVAHVHNDRINTCVIEAAKDDATDKDKLYVFYLYTDLTNSNPNQGYYTYISPLFEYDHDATVGDGWNLLRSDFSDIHQPESQYTNFEVNPKNADVMYFPNRRLGKTRDKGQNINNISSGNYVNSAVHDDNRDIIIVDIDPNGANNQDVLIAGNDGGVSKGEYYASSNPLLYLYGWININQGSNSTPVNDRLIASQCTDISISNNISGTDKVILGGAIDNANYIKNSANFAWANIGNVDGGQTAINETYGLAYTRRNGVFEIFDINTLSSVHQFTPNFGGSGYDDFAEIKIDRSDPDRFYIGKYRYFKGYELNSNFQPSLLTNINFDFTSLLDQHYNTSISCFEIDPNHPNKMLLAFNKGTQYGVQWNPRFFKSDDYGVSWTVIGNTVSNPTGPFMVDVDGNILNPIENNYITDICYSIDKPHFVWASISQWATPETTQNSGNVAINSRVIHSTDGGNNWEDFSEGLTAAPINAIVYQEGSEGVLFAATDVGVYRYNPTPGIEKWECFNQGFPVSLVNDLEISNCEQKIYASAYGRGIWESALPPLERCDITANTIWDTDREVLATTVVKSGKRLTIKNCTVNMARGTSIIVEAGAELIIHNATLTNGCGEMWDGIVVKGNATASQYGSFPNNAQGKVILRNNAKVEYALDAVRVWDPIDGGGISKAGGIVQANSVTFLNNQRDIEFMKYENVNLTTGNYARNLSYFAKCTFELDDDYRGNDLDSRVTMWAVSGINFNGCTFKNINQTLQQTYQTAGIYSIDAGYDIDIHCNGAYAGPCPANKTVKSSFDNFYYGVRANNSLGNSSTITVKKAQFGGNVYGVLTEKMDNANILGCDFEVGSGVGPGWSAIGNYGVYVNTGTLYEIQENTFTDDGSFNTAPYSIGVYINESGPDDNDVRKNDYNNLNYANIAYGTNRKDGDNDAGLQFLCNNQVDNKYDIYVWGNGLGIRGIQGNPFGQNGIVGDGNRFSQNTITIPERNYYFQYPNIAQHSKRYYLPNIPTNYAQNYTTLYLSQENIANNEECASYLDDGGAVVIDDPAVGGRPGLITDFNNHEANYITTVYLYDNLIDGGNTVAMSNNVQFNWAADAWTLRDELVAESPNLSQEVLLDAAFTGVLPDALLMEVLLANPNSVKDEEFLYILENEIPNPLPQSMTDLLRMAQESASLRTDLENQMAHYHYQKSQAGQLLVSGILRDSVPNLDSLVYWLDRLNTLHSKYGVAEVLLEKGQVAQGQALLNGLITQYSYAERYAADYQAYVQLYNLKANIVQSNRSWLDISEGEKTQLQNIAYNTNADAAIQARNVLCFFFEECYDPIAGLPDNTTNRVINISDPQLELTKQLSSIVVYPNPATTFVTFEYKLPEYLSNAHLTITDVTGKVIHSITLSNFEGQYLWDTRQMKNGLYFYTLKDNDGKNIVSGKVSIFK